MNFSHNKKIITTTINIMIVSILLSTSIFPFLKLVYALKSKVVKRQYPAMLGRFFDFIKIEEESIEQKCKVFYDFTSKVENRKVLESQLM